MGDLLRFTRASIALLPKVISSSIAVAQERAVDCLRFEIGEHGIYSTDADTDERLYGLGMQFRGHHALQYQAGVPEVAIQCTGNSTRRHSSEAIQSS